MRVSKMRSSQKPLIQNVRHLAQALLVRSRAESENGPPIGGGRSLMPVCWRPARQVAHVLAACIKGMYAYTEVFSRSGECSLVNAPSSLAVYWPGPGKCAIWIGTALGQVPSGAASSPSTRCSSSASAAISPFPFVAWLAHTTNGKRC